MASDEKVPVCFVFGSRGLIDPGDLFLARDVNQADSAGFKAGEHISQHQLVFIRFVEVAEGREHAQDEVERIGPQKVAHVRFHPFDFDLGGFCFCFGLVQKELRSVHAGDGESLLRQGNRPTTGSTAEIQDGFPFWFGQFQHLADLGGCVGKPLLWKHVSIKFPPEQIVIEPFLFSLSAHFFVIFEFGFCSRNFLKSDWRYAIANTRFAGAL
jgi:hypothetical protein